MRAAEALAHRKRLSLQTDRQSRLVRLACYDPCDDWTYNVTLPHPAVLGTVWALRDLREQGLEVYSRPGLAGLYVRPVGSGAEPKPLELEAAAKTARERLAALPEAPEGGTSEAYRATRLAARYGDRATVTAYLVDALLAARSDAKSWQLPQGRPALEQRPRALAPSARQRIHRAGLADRQDATSALVLSEYLGEWRDDGQPAGFVLASTLWREAAVIALGLAGFDDFSLATPGRNGFFAVADQLLGARIRRASGAGYVIPDASALDSIIRDAEEYAYDAADGAIAATDLTLTGVSRLRVLVLVDELVDLQMGH